MKIGSAACSSVEGSSDARDRHEKHDPRLRAGKELPAERSKPRVRQAPGFVAAYWVRLGGNQGSAMLVFETEDAARQMTEQLRPPEGVVTIDSIEVGEVVEHA
jgi:hypothetical protein